LRYNTLWSTLVKKWRKFDDWITGTTIRAIRDGKEKVIGRRMRQFLLPVLKIILKQAGLKK
jgi:hypothetical protein